MYFKGYDSTFVRICGISSQTLYLSNFYDFILDVTCSIVLFSDIALTGRKYRLVGSKVFKIVCYMRKARYFYSIAWTAWPPWKFYQSFASTPGSFNKQSFLNTFRQIF